MLVNYTDCILVSIFRIRWKFNKEAMEMELEPLSVDEYQTFLQILQINLPEGALNPEV